MKIIKILTKEKFEKVRNSGNYGFVSKEVEDVVSKAKDLDLLELEMEAGFDLKVVGARIVDEKLFAESISGLRE